MLSVEQLAEALQHNQKEKTTIPETQSETSRDITPATPEEVAIEIKSNINPKKTQGFKGFNLITVQILKQLLRKGEKCCLYILLM